MKGVLQRVALRVHVSETSEETVELLCRLGIEELKMYNVSVRAMLLLFLHGAGSSLAGRLRRLEMHVDADGRAARAVYTMPFPGLEHLDIHVYTWDLLGIVCDVLGDGIRSRVGMLSVRGPSSSAQRNVRAIAELGSLEELRLTHCTMQKGDLWWAIAGRRGLKRLEVHAGGIRTTITAEDVNAVVAVESLREVSIIGYKIGLGTLEMLVRNRAFVGRLYRLKLHVFVDAWWFERPSARLKALGMTYEDGFSELDTQTIDIADVR